MLLIGKKNIGNLVVIGESSPLSNIVTSWGPGVVTNAHQRRTAAENQPPAQPRRCS